MNTNEADIHPVEKRREFLHELQRREDVVNTDLTRDGFLTVYVRFSSPNDFPDALRERAHQLDYRYTDLGETIYCLSQE